MFTKYQIMASDKYYSDNGIPVAQAYSADFQTSFQTSPPYGQQGSTGGLQHQASAPVMGHNDEMATKQFLAAHNWPRGLQETLIASTSKFPMRFMIIDDSGSMQANDGHRLMNGKSGPVLVPFPFRI